MSRTVLSGRQVKDADGYIIDGCGNYSVDINGDVTAESIFSGIGALLRVIIWQDVDSGTFQLTDSDGTNLFPAAKTDYAGAFEVRRFLTNGCKITTSGFTGGGLTVIYFK